MRRRISGPATEAAGLRIAILGSRGIPARYGGFETFAEELGAGLVERGFRVTVFCERHSTQPSPSHRGIRLVHLRPFPLGPLRTVLFDVASLLRALREYDVVYMLGYGAAWAFVLPRLFGVPLIVNTDGIEWRRAKWSLLARSYLKSMEGLSVRLASGVITDAEAIRTHLEPQHGPIRKCWTIPYGAHVVPSPPDPTLLEPFRISPGDYYIGVCRLEPENHVLDIIKAHKAAELSKSLVVVGGLTDSSYVQAIRATASGGVLFLGEVYDQKTLTALRYYSRAYLHGHSVGGTNPSLLESLACGSEVIAHDNAFNREVLGPLGRYFRNVETLVRLWHEVDSSPQTDESRERYRAIVRGKYSWGHVITAYEQLFEGLRSRAVR